MVSRAQWITGIPDLSADLTKVPQHLTVAQVSSQTGYSSQTILDLLSRDPIDVPTNPLEPLSRPAARIGTTPLYSQKQVDQCLHKQAAQTGKHVGGTTVPLPKYSEEEANRRGLIDLNTIAELAGVHAQTVRKWKTRRADFPRPVGQRERPAEGHSGVPFVVWSGAAIRRWLNEGRFRSDDETDTEAELIQEAV